MDIFQGKSVFSSIAIGKLFIYKKQEQQIKRQRIEDSDAEIKRFETAKSEAIHQLQGLYEKALVEVGEANAQIFEIHQMMLDDDDYLDAILNIIKVQKVNAEYAVATTADNFANIFANMDDDYMRERAADVKDVSERVIKILFGGGNEQQTFDEPVIIVAEDLAPSETVQLDKDKVLAFVTQRGSSNSHTAILARTMNIPALIGTNIDLDESLNGTMAIVDGFSGQLFVNPDDETISAMKKRIQEEADKKELLKQLKGKDSVTLDGQKVHLYANIGGEGDLASVLENDAEGIGLFRSEFLYLEKDTYPTEAEQFNVYRKVLETMAGKKVVIRTLDIGADKQIDYFELDKEENPALGYRAVRICLDRPDIFKTQLRALYRASAYGTLSIMVPMVISMQEVLEIKRIVGEVKEELDAVGLPYSDVELGIMIETPAAAIISDKLAKEVDFFSIGTNDLTQYLLAIDRQNPKLDKIYDPHHLAVLRMIKLVTDNAHANGIWMGICGELAADPALTQTFISMGVDELSVSPAFLLGLRKAIRETDVSKVKDTLLAVLD